MNFKTTSLVLIVATGLIATGCASVRNRISQEPVTITGQAPSGITTPKKAIACAELAGVSCHMTKVASTDNILVTVLDYPRCQIRFLSSFTVDNNLSYTIALDEIQMEGKGHNYTVNYINRILEKWSREIQAEMLKNQIVQ